MLEVILAPIAIGYFPWGAAQAAPAPDEYQNVGVMLVDRQYIDAVAATNEPDVLRYLSVITGPSQIPSTCEPDSLPAETMISYTKAVRRADYNTALECLNLYDSVDSASDEWHRYLAQRAPRELLTVLSKNQSQPTKLNHVSCDSDRVPKDLLSVSVSIDGRCLNALLDTGATGILMSDTLSDEIGVINDRSVLDFRLFGRIGNPSLVQTYPESDWSELAESGIDLAVGLHFLVGSTLHLNPKNFEIVPGASGSQPDRGVPMYYDGSYLTVEANINRQRVLCNVDTGASYSFLTLNHFSGDQRFPGRLRRLSTPFGIHHVAMSVEENIRIGSTELILKDVSIDIGLATKFSENNEFECVIGMKDLAAAGATIDLFDNKLILP